jgi:hypothetical protein
MIPLHESLDPTERFFLRQKKVRQDVFGPFPVYSIVSHAVVELVHYQC